MSSGLHFGDVCFVSMKPVFRVKTQKLKTREAAPSSPFAAPCACPLQAIQEQATLEDSPHVGQTHRRVHVLALQPLPCSNSSARVLQCEAVPRASSQRLRGTLRRQQPSSERRRRSRSPAACARCVANLDPRTRQNGRQASPEPVRLRARHPFERRS